MERNVACAVFEEHTDAYNAVSELRHIGIPLAAISVLDPPDDHSTGLHIANSGVEVDGEDAEYFEASLRQGGVFVSVDTRMSDGRGERAREILAGWNGHDPSRAQLWSVRKTRESMVSKAT